MGQFISQPVTEKFVETYGRPHISMVVGQMQGYRVSMEDAHCCWHKTLEITSFGGFLQKYEIDIVGVFDGHGGKNAAQYVGERLPHIIFGLLKEQLVEHKNAIGTRYAETDCLVETINFTHIIKNAFFKCDSELYSRRIKSGSTAVVVIILNGIVFTANIGDSRCILHTGKHDTVKNLSFDHKPKHYGELFRIHSDGGHVQANRVGGVLALSRAFGDFTFKCFNQANYARLLNNKKMQARANLEQRNYNNMSVSLEATNKSSLESLTVPEEFQVTAEPDIVIHTITSEDHFLILACDGVWDCYNNEPLVRQTRHFLSLDLSLNVVVEKLLDLCIRKANTITGVGFDNMTLILVALHPLRTVNQWQKKLSSEILAENT